LEVQDTGIGIAAKDFERLFVEFQQLDASSAKKYPGTGLGLALTKKIVEAHGGSVEVRSVLGEGSTFAALLPRRMAPAPEERFAAPRPAFGRSVLVVDDDAGSLKLAAATLVERGFRAVFARTGQEALRLVESDPPAVIVLDLLMPGMDGFEFIDRLRALPAGSDTPVVLWTVKDLTADDRSRLRTTVSAIVPKGSGSVAVLIETFVGLLGDSGQIEAEQA
jgi:CheY-like chemotaxis protein